MIKHVLGSYVFPFSLYGLGVIMPEDTATKVWFGYSCFIVAGLIFCWAAFKDIKSYLQKRKNIKIKKDEKPIKQSETIDISNKTENLAKSLTSQNTDHDRNSISDQISQQASKVINNNLSGGSHDKTFSQIIIPQKSDKEIRDYIEEEMKNLSLINADFDQLSQKFINASVNWIVKVDWIEKDDDGNYKVFFDQTNYSRVECFTVSPEVFPIINFAKKKDKYRIQAQIKHLDSIRIELDRISHLEKL